MTVRKSTVQRLRGMRASGLTVREISLRTGVSTATVHRYVRNVEVTGHHPVGTQGNELKTDHGFRKAPERYIAIKNRGSLYGGLLVHMPELLTCPVCGEDSKDVVFCLDCGNCWMNECAHGSELRGETHKGINLSEVRRNRGDGELHVFPLVFRGSDGVPDAEFISGETIDEQTTLQSQD